MWMKHGLLFHPTSGNRRKLNFFIAFFSLTLVVPLLTYLLTKKGLTLEEVNGHAIDVVAAGVRTVS